MLRKEEEKSWGCKIPISSLRKSPGGDLWGFSTSTLVLREGSIVQVSLWPSSECLFGSREVEEGGKQLLVSNKSVWVQRKAWCLMILYPLPINGLVLHRWPETEGRAAVGQLRVLSKVSCYSFFSLWSVFWFFTIWEHLLAFFWNSEKRILLVFWSLSLAIPRNNGARRNGPKEVTPFHFAPYDLRYTYSPGKYLKSTFILSLFLRSLKEWNTPLRVKFESLDFEYFLFNFIV